MSVESTFIEAARNHNLCMLTDPQGNTRIVEPYMVYTSSTGKRLFHCYQLEGYSESGRPAGWKNPEAESFLFAQIRDPKFAPRPEYNPFNLKMFPIVHFSIPTDDGRQR
jgi:hypothetical protein